MTMIDKDDGHVEPMAITQEDHDDFYEDYQPPNYPKYNSDYEGDEDVDPEDNTNLNCHDVPDVNRRSGLTERRRDYTPIVEERRNDQLRRIISAATISAVISVILIASLALRSPSSSNYSENNLSKTPPPANLDELCSPAKFSLSNGREECRQACEPAACCLHLGCTSSKEINPDICISYSSCFILLIPESDSEIPTGPPAEPPPNLPHTCSPESINTQHGFYDCESTCRIGKCCFSKTYNENCFEKYPEVCREYAPCENLEMDGHVSDIDLVALYCTVDNIASPDGRERCAELCSARDCCFTNGYANCFEDNNAWCMEYAPCEDLTSPLDVSGEYGVGPGKKKYDGLEGHGNVRVIEPDVACSDENKEKDIGLCQKACAPATCCFMKEEDCFDGANVDCEKYAICQPLVVTLMEDDFSQGGNFDDDTDYELDDLFDDVNDDLVYDDLGIDYVPILPDVDVGMLCSKTQLNYEKGRDLCETECYAGRCCIGLQSTSCAAQKDICKVYEPCNALWYHDDFSPHIFQGHDHSITTIPQAPKDLDGTCNYDYVMTDEGYVSCELECKPALCCVGVPFSCAETQGDACGTYYACHVVWTAFENEELDLVNGKADQKKQQQETENGKKKLLKEAKEQEKQKQEEAEQRKKEQDEVDEYIKLTKEQDSPKENPRSSDENPSSDNAEYDDLTFREKEEEEDTWFVEQAALEKEKQKQQEEADKIDFGMILSPSEQCSRENMMFEGGRESCIETCVEWKCCWALDKANNCFGAEPECDDYRLSCPQSSWYTGPTVESDLLLSHTDDFKEDDKPTTVPEMVDSSANYMDVKEQCGKDLSIVNNLSGCREVCEPYKCCWQEGSSNCVKQHPECESFLTHCPVAVTLKINGDAKSQQKGPKSLCTTDKLQTRDGREDCLEDCMAWKCCWGEGEDEGCEDTPICEEYVDYCPNSGL